MCPIAKVVNAMPDANYIIQLTSLRLTSGNQAPAITYYKNIFQFSDLTKPKTEKLENFKSDGLKNA